MMRSVLASVLALGLLITLCASASAAKVRHLKPLARHSRPGPNFTVPNGFAVPGWTDEETRQWLDNGSRGSHEG